MRVESVERFSGNVNRVREELDAVGRQDRVLIACQTVESERVAAIAAANERIAAKRAEANAATDAARIAASAHVRAAVVDVSARAAELATGRKPVSAFVDQVVGNLMGAKS